MKKLILSAVLAACCSGVAAQNLVRIPHLVQASSKPADPPPVVTRPSTISVAPYTFDFKGSLLMGEYAYGPVTVAITGNTSVTFGKVSAVGHQRNEFLASTTAPSLTRPCIGTFVGGDTCQVFVMFIAQEASTAPRTASLNVPNNGVDAQGKAGPQGTSLAFEGTVRVP